MRVQVPPRAPSGRSQHPSTGLRAGSASKSGRKKFKQSPVSVGGTMKITFRSALAGALLLLLRVAPLCAGTVQVGILKASDYDKWLCDPSMPLATAPAAARCASAKFQGCSSSCDTVVVTNNSAAPVEVELEFSGPGFSPEQSGGMFIFGSPNETAIARTAPKSGRPFYFLIRAATWLSERAASRISNSVRSNRVPVADR